MVSYFDAIIIGVIQGIVEWLPISSEGNLIIIMLSLFDLDPIAALKYALFLHLGTGIAATIYFRKEILELLSAETDEMKKFRLQLTIITLVTGIIGLPIWMVLKFSSNFGELLLALTGTALVITGLIQRKTNEIATKTSTELSIYESLALGIAQGLAIIPGLSRSGITSSILLFRGFSGEESFKISFLMSIPASFGAAALIILFEGFDITINSTVSLITTFIIGIISIDVLLKMVKKISFWKLCVILGLIALGSYVSSFLVLHFI